MILSHHQNLALNQSFPQDASTSFSQNSCDVIPHQIASLPSYSHFLLGFSGGVDSSALFFLLLESGVKFDLGIVDYGLREESRLEVDYAKRLARQYGLQCHILKSPHIVNNFEANARKIRYEFFKNLVDQYHYDGVILAHQLNDRLEWFLMQFAKGAGLNTLLGFDFRSEVLGMPIFRPLLEVSKKELYAFCKQREIVYFEDSSNQDEKFLRNQYRNLASFLAQSGIRASFEYLLKEKEILYSESKIEQLGEVRGFQRRGALKDLHTLDLELKKLGFVLSRGKRREIERCGFSCEVGDVVIESNEAKIFFFLKSPHQHFRGKMEKKHREQARKMRIPKRLREVFCIFLIHGGSWVEIEEFLRLKKEE